jgi:hypothetical protein
MKDLYININPELIYYPVVDFNAETGKCEISGESYMEETYAFYEPVISWFKEYIAIKKPIVFDIKLTYFNTSSSRFILEILDMLKNYKDDKGSIQVIWHYRKEDPDMLNEINDISEETGMEIQVIPFSN